MNKLKNKVFFTILTILTIFLVSFITIYNIKNYVEQKNSIRNSLNVATNTEKNKNTKEKQNNIPSTNTKNIPEKPNKQNEEKPLDENVKFMDSTIYTILLDNDDKIKDIINRSNNQLSESEISNLANTLLKDKNLKQRYIGCLYISDYSYVYIKGNSLTIIDNTNIKNSLTISLVISILALIILEIIIIFISKKITNWIIKPVKESFEKQKQFITDASHELKTPLSVIMASSEALTESPNETKWLKNIQTESERMNSLITDLLDLAQSERKNTNNFKLGNLSKLIELSILTFEGRAYEKNIKLDYKIEKDIKFTMDENSIKQLIEILLDNAIKHSKEENTINIKLKNINNNIELTIQNTGEEIPKGEEEKIFERFYRIDKSRNRNENRYGLGLAIAKNIVENHKGKITASSSNGVTTFKVLFKK